MYITTPLKNQDFSSMFRHAISRRWGKELTNSRNEARDKSFERSKMTNHGKSNGIASKQGQVFHPDNAEEPWRASLSETEKLGEALGAASRIFCFVPFEKLAFELKRNAM